MNRGFCYLVAIIDWHTRYIVSWKLSTTLEIDFCIQALHEALQQGQPEIFNSDYTENETMSKSNYQGCLILLF